MSATVRLFKATKSVEWENFRCFKIDFFVRVEQRLAFRWIEIGLIDSAENDKYSVAYDADHESGLGFQNFAMFGELWPKNYFSPHQKYNY